MVTIRVTTTWAGGSGVTQVSGPVGRAAPTWWTRMPMTPVARAAWESTWYAGDLDPTPICSE